MRLSSLRPSSRRGKIVLGVACLAVATALPVGSGQAGAGDGADGHPWIGTIEGHHDTGRIRPHIGAGSIDGHPWND